MTQGKSEFVKKEELGFVLFLTPLITEIQND
jgi:hypothetical protein